MIAPPFLMAAGVGLVLGLLIGFGAATTRARAQQEVEKQKGLDEASRILKRAETEADNARKAGELAGREEGFRLREAWEKEEARRREEIERSERRAAERSDASDRQLERLNSREGELEARTEALATREFELEREAESLVARSAEARHKLQQLAGMTEADAKAALIADLQDVARAEAANSVREIKERAENEAEREARKIVALSIQRMAADLTAETTVSVVHLPSEDMKGRIIGREGRNIRSFEEVTGVDVVIDDTPNAVVLSAFDPVRRETARISLERLVEDGRIHPGRIEEVVDKAAIEVEKGMVEAAEEVLYELGLHNVHPEIVKTLGRLRFRTSYGQNQLQHAREVALLAANMASEMGLDVQGTKRAAILHDVGKGMTHEHEGTHVELGYRLCKKHNETPLVLNAIKAHHDEEPHFFAETFLVTAADAISGSRPGARREMFDGYVKRLEKLEGLAMEHEGVSRCFAIQAGRELRVMVEPESVGDGQMAQISESVARRIESELQYPGQIKVVVVRETRAVDFAR